MGNRKDLLVAAKMLVRTKGYSRTTARDITKQAQTSLASIGYHYRTTEALLNTALIESMAEFGEQFRSALPGNPKTKDFSKRFSGLLNDAIASMIENRQPWLANLEALAEVDNVPGLREEIARGMNDVRAGFGQLLAPDADAAQQVMIGTLCAALVNGLIAQWLVDPDNAPQPKDIIDGIKAIAKNLS